MRTSYTSTTDPAFLGALERWLKQRGEILVLIRYSHAAGSKDFEFFTSYQSLLERIRELPPRSSITAFKEPQLPIRGVVSDELIARCLEIIPDDAEYLVVETVRRVHGRRSWFHDYAGVTQSELRDDLEESRGVPVAVGLYPVWLDDSENVISAVVPDEHGVPKIGIY